MRYIAPAILSIQRASALIQSTQSKIDPVNPDHATMEFSLNPAYEADE